jgi:peroxiredoxin
MTRAFPKNCLLCLLCLAVAAGTGAAQREQNQRAQPAQPAQEDKHQYASLREAEAEVKDFTFTTLDDGRVNLREAARGKRLVLIHYFASWCHNSNFDVATMTELYDKYRDRGFLVIGVCEYSSRNELRGFIKKHNPTYPICLENDGKKKDRVGTTHYAYRSKAGDDRLWGTPFNILIADSDIQNEGEVFARRIRVAPGEAIKTELEEVIRHHLQLN